MRFLLGILLLGALATAGGYIGYGVHDRAGAAIGAAAGATVGYIAARLIIIRTGSPGTASK